MAETPRAAQRPIAVPLSDNEPRTGSLSSDGDAGSIAGILQGIVGNVQNIIRSEVQLAKTEMKEDASTYGKAAGMLVAGAVLGIYAIGLLLLMFVYLLSQVMDDWIAALIVFVVVAAIAGVLAMVGMKRIKSVKPGPEQTIETLKEDVQWVKQQTS